MARVLLVRRAKEFAMKQREGPSLHTALASAAIGMAAGLALRAVVRMHRRIRLDGKTALVTGGTRGLGLELARELAAHGARVAICGRDPDELDRAEADLRGRGADVLAVQCDVTVREQVQGMAAGIARHFGSLDVVINNAGTISVGPVETMTLTDFDDAMKLHFWAPLYTTIAAVPHMKRAGGGRIVNISSIGGKIAVPHLIPYSASKFALTGLSEGLRSELMKDNIYVTTVSPGLMRTGSPRNAIFKGQHEKEYAWFAISDSLPGTSMSSKRAARRIVRACRDGEGEVLLSLPAKLAVTFHDLFPGITSDLSALINGLLPAPGGIGMRHALGRESESPLTQSPLTLLSQRAAVANNQMQ
jgi:NAD(P)-dependent dehydrogenase (short-subunit alcohol dehydrogenase family)